ncbi:hypothetical protein IKS86_09575 [bacterium]|nr:hypothetical protein [bacterium]
MLLNEFIPVDKSSAIRAFLFSLFTDDDVEVICGSVLPEDVISAINCLNLFGKIVEQNGVSFKISSKAKKPVKAIDCGNSATMMHILMGISVYLGDDFELTGDKSLMSRNHSDFSEAAKLYHGNFVETTLTKESAQLKSFHLISMLKNGGKLHFKSRTRRNTEDLLTKMGAKIVENQNCIEVFSLETLHGYSVEIKLDPSSAFITACAAFVFGRSFEISNIYHDDSRMTPFLLLQNAGFDIKIEEDADSFKVSGTPLCKEMHDINVSKDQVAEIIDEIPFIAFIVARIGKTFTVKNASWLRNKESDRISESVKRFSLTFETEEFTDGFSVSGAAGHALKGDIPHSFDHRMEMLSSLIALDNGVDFKMNASYKISFPKFYELFKYLKND